MHPEIEKLIKLAIADGEVTEKERAVIMRKAEKLSEDIDEVEMILDGELALHLKTVDSENSNKTQSNKEGILKKCPSCGAAVKSFVTKCSECGHEYSNIELNASIQKLFEMLNEVESERNEKNLTKELLARVWFGASYSLPDKINNRKKEIIKNFPISTTKNDILEFLALAVPNAKKIGNFFTSGAFNSPANERNKKHNEFTSTWHAKCEQIILKARFSMKDDIKTLEEIENYAKQLGIR